jgi:hypothetical protein
VVGSSAEPLMLRIMIEDHSLGLMGFVTLEKCIFHLLFNAPLDEKYKRLPLKSWFDTEMTTK